MHKVAFIQNNIWGEHGYDKLVLSLGEYFEVVVQHLVPFAERFERPVPKKVDIVFGSGRFVELARNADLPTFPSFKPIESFYPNEYWVNGDGYACEWRELQIDQPKFIKPFREKFFTGVVVESQADLDKVQLCTSFVDDPLREKIWVSDPVAILQEVRLFVIGEAIVTGSLYKQRGHDIYSAIDGCHAAWLRAAELLSSHGTIAPNAAFVMDMGLTSEGWKIVELNNFNSAGLYHSDTAAMARSLALLV